MINSISFKEYVEIKFTTILEFLNPLTLNKNSYFQLLSMFPTSFFKQNF